MTLLLVGDPIAKESGGCWWVTPLLDEELGLLDSSLVLLLPLFYRYGDFLFDGLYDPLFEWAFFDDLIET